MITLNDWHLSVAATVVGKRHTDEKRIQTSPLVSLEGDVVTTKSGSKYKLGTCRYADGLETVRQLIDSLKQ